MTDPSVASPPASPARPGLRDDRAFLVGLAAVVVIPLVVGVWALRRPTWTPVLDMAMTELRVRDVGGTDTPLIGLPGRIFGAGGEQGSHPGPLSFWLLAPGYRLFGSSSWALHLSAALLDVVAVVAALWLGLRIGGRQVAVAVALAISVVVVALGLGAVLEPWNPYLPVLWWLVFLLALWAVLGGDGPAALVLVFSGSLCAQTHVPYLSLCLALGGLGALALLARARRAPQERGALLRWGGAGVALGALLWVPPTVDQLTVEPGNYGLLLDNFASPDEPSVGLGTALREGLQRFDLVHLLADPIGRPGLLTHGRIDEFPLAWRGALLLAAWAALGALAWRRSPGALRRLHAVVAGATAVGFVSLSRILGNVWFYLVLWMWVVALAALAAAVWSGVVLLEARRGARSTVARWIPVGLLLTALVGVRSIVAAPDAAPSDPEVSAVLAAVADPTSDALVAGLGAADGPDGRYVVGFDDSLHIGSQAYGLVSELERRGLHAYMEPFRAVPITPQRTLDRAGATARVQLANGPHIARWRALADEGVVEAVQVDLRTPEERAEQAALRTEVEEQLVAEGLSDLLPRLDDNLFLAAIDQRASRELRVKMDRMLRIGGPTSIFIAPPDVSPP